MSELDEYLAKLDAEASRLEEDCVYNSTGQFVAGRRWQITEYLLDLPAVLLTAFAAVFAFTDRALLAGVLSVVVLLLTTASLFLQPATRTLRHRNAAEKYLALRTAVRLYKDVELRHLNRGRDRLNEQLISFVERKVELNTDSPPIPDAAYKEAKSRILQGRTTHDVDLSRKSASVKAQ